MVKAKHMVLVIAILLVGIFVLYGYLGYMNRRKPLTLDEATLKRTFVLIERCERLESGTAYLTREDVIPFLRTNESSGLSMGQIFFVMANNSIVDIEKITDDTNIMDTYVHPHKIPTMADAWGRALNFAWRSDAAGNIFPNVLLKKQFPVLIWSSGPNGSNEWGRGDDVFTPFDESKQFLPDQ
jgi:hypothetical protein